MPFRIGINLGDVIQDAERIYGDGVNIAARLEGLADSGGICISRTAFDQIESKLPYGYEFLGNQPVKNIARPVGAYRVLMEPRVTAAGKQKKEIRSRVRRIPILVGTAAVFIIVAAIGFWQLYAHRPSAEPAAKGKMPSSLPEKPSIAVLPFTNLNNNPEQEYFADGMTDELITDLSKISGLLVISRNSSFTYKGKTVKVQQVAEELNVKYVLEGSIQRAGDRVRIRAQLIDGASDHHLWAESYDAVMENIFDLQDEITRKIAAVLTVKLTAGEQNRFTNKKTINIEAYDAFVKGWEHFHRETPEDMVQAITSLKQAIEIEADYSRAHAALALAYLRSSRGFKWQTVNRVPSELHLLARKHLDLAMRKPTSTAHLVASKMALIRRQYEDAVTHAQLALAFDANDPDANLNMAQVLMATGKLEEGLEYSNKTIQLDPRNIARPLNEAGMAYFIMGDLQKSATMTERSLKHNPTTIGHYERLAAIYALLGRDKDAQAAFENSLKAYHRPFMMPDVIFLMSRIPIKDRQVADRYAGGLSKAGFPGLPSDYYKIIDENRLTGEKIRPLVAGHEITVYQFWRTLFVDHNENGTLYFSGTKGKWWIEGDMLCYQLERGRGKDLKDCGEIYRNTDGTTVSKYQYLHVKDYTTAALSTN
jgi:TolB-like protein